MNDQKEVLLSDFDVSPERGFLPAKDPLTQLPPGWEFLDDFGNILPELIESGKLLSYAKILPIPPADHLTGLDKRQLQLAWVRYVHIQSAYVHVQKKPPFVICKNIAKPVLAISKILKVRPILPYSGYVLYNWKRKNPTGPIGVDNLELIQVFIRDSDQSWFNLIHVDIESKFGQGVRYLWDSRLSIGDYSRLEQNLGRIYGSLVSMITVMKRMPEGTSPDTYYKIRPWIWSFENVIYEGIDEFNGQPQNFRGQTGAQTSIFQSIEAGLQMPKLSDNKLAFHLMDMRNHMPDGHRRFIEYLEANSKVRDFIILYDQRLISQYDDCVYQELTFLAMHLGYAYYYIHKQTNNPKGTGGTDDFMEYLGGRIKERWDTAFIWPRSEDDFKLFSNNIRKMVKELVQAA